MANYELSGWDLSELFGGNLQNAFAAIEEKVKIIEAKRALLTEGISAKDFLEIVGLFSELTISTRNLVSYAGLKFAENSSDHETAALQSVVDNFVTKVSNRTLFFGLWFKDLLEGKANELISASGKYRYYFEMLRKYKPYVLKENEEKIINIKDTTGISALEGVYEVLTSQFIYLLDGKEISRSELQKIWQGPDREKRKLAYSKLFEKYSHYKDVLSLIYTNVVNGWREENLHLRGFKTPIQVRNFANDIPDKAVDALLKVVQKNYGIFQRYFEIKRKKLGLDRMHRHDLYAPLSSKEEKIPYGAAAKIILETFEKFSPIFGELAERMFEKNRVHSKLQKNKDNGAFCLGLGTRHDPYVLVNYVGTSRDVATLAHELGHAVHDMLAIKQTELTWHPCLPLAETASTFGEILVSEALMEKYPERAEELIMSKLDDLYATIARQAGFTIFEKKAHDMIKEGKTREDLNKFWIDDLRKQLGPNVEVDESFRNEWLVIPHIYRSPFYCYAYCFGNLLVLSLYEMYKEEGQGFVPKMIKLLEAGGSAPPTEIAMEIGVDITSEQFWEKGFKVIEEMVSRLERA